MIKESTSALDCSVVELYLSGGTLAVRTYPAPSVPPGSARNAWAHPPYVGSVTRCGQRYVFQVWSKSKKAWVVDRARVEGSKDEPLLMAVPRFNQVADRDINVISVEALPGAKFSNITLHLTGQDGRVAQVEARDLP